MAGPGSKITELTANTAPLTTDLLVMVDDPTGTALSQKITIANLLTLMVSNVVVQTFVADGTYTPTALMKKCLVICVGGGGGGGGGLNTDSAGAGGGGGGTSIELISAATIGASKTVHVGAGGAGGASGVAPAAGAASHLGADASELLIGGGGQPGANGGTAWSSGDPIITAGGAGGTASDGDLNIAGQPGTRGYTWSGSNGRGGIGGLSFLGGSGLGPAVNTAGVIGGAYGAGGGGGHASAVTDKNGGAGKIGVVYVIEFLG